MDDVFARPEIELERRPDGTVVLRSTTTLRPYRSDLAAPLLYWAATRPDATLAAQWRDPHGWVTVTYAEARDRAEAVAEALLERGLGLERPLVVLSGNSLDHLVLTLAGYLAGIPVAPLSVTYSLGGDNLDRLHRILEIVGPGAVFAEDGTAFANALAAARKHCPLTLVGDRTVDCEPLSDLERTAPGPLLAKARAAVGPHTLAKILFTSGSTGEPKAVPNTHGMLSAVQQMMRQVWPFLARTRLDLLDWLPWSHTFGGNHNLNMVLASGGTFRIDDGGATPQLFPRSLARLRELSPNVYFNVPAGFDLLATQLEDDAAFATRFFSRMRLILSAGAPLPEELRTRVLAVARKACDHEVVFTSSWGLTETSSAVTSAHHATDEPGAIGVPLPGISLKLAPIDGRWELRAAGPSVMPGYLHPRDAEDVFDDEGYYRTGDLGRLVDPDDPGLGVVFDGRLAEDFKLATGTWVRVGALRAALLKATGVFTDVVIAAPGRPYLGALCWLRPDAPTGAQLLARLGVALTAFNAGAGSSRRIRRLLVLSEPPSRAEGELSAKGTVNQRRVLERRQADVQQLFRNPSLTGMNSPGGLIIEV